MKTMNKEPNILVWDIETSFNVVATFSLFNDAPINHRNVLQEWNIISVSWKWLGEKKVHSISVADDAAMFEANPGNDYAICVKMQELFEKADAVVHHYGDKFDLPKVNARLAFHRLAPLKPVVQIDTKKIASKHFKFNSNRLDYLGIFLGVGQKIDTPPDLWLRCLYGDKKAVEEMVRYNKGDVKLLEAVFNVLYPFAALSINKRLFLDKDDICPKCGGKHLQYRGYRYTLARKYRRFQCTDCGSWGHSRKHEPIIKENV